MARLILSLDGHTMAEYTMNKERYTIGRLPDNDIRIDNPAVSGHHSLIINILNDSFLEDLNSTNGTYVNGKLVKKHALQHGDIVTVGHHQLRFVEEDDQQDEFEKTMVIQPSARPLDSVRRAEARVGAFGAMAGLPSPAAPAAAQPASPMASYAPQAPAAEQRRPGKSPDEQPDQKPQDQGGLDQRQAEALLNSAAREERDVQGRKQRQGRTPPGGKDW